MPLPVDTREALLELSPDAMLMADEQALCGFPEVPVPESPMPHLNDAASFRAMVACPRWPEIGLRGALRCARGGRLRQQRTQGTWRR